MSRARHLAGALAVVVAVAGLQHPGGFVPWSVDAAGACVHFPGDGPWSGAGDAPNTAPEGGGNVDNLDLVNVDVGHTPGDANAQDLTVRLQVKNMSQAIPANATSLLWHLDFDYTNSAGVSRHYYAGLAIQAVQSSPSRATGLPGLPGGLIGGGTAPHASGGGGTTLLASNYSVGTYDSSTGLYVGVHTTTGSIQPGHGGWVTINVPIADLDQNPPGPASGENLTNLQGLTFLGYSANGNGATVGVDSDSAGAATYQVGSTCEYGPAEAPRPAHIGTSAGDTGAGQATALVTDIQDQWINPANDGWTVSEAMSGPDGTVTNSTSLTGNSGVTGETSALVDGTLTHIAGAYGYTATAGTVSAKATFHVAPAAAAGSFTLAATPNPVQAGQQVSIGASSVKDQYGNTVSDGTTIQFHQTDAAGTVSSFSARTTAGVASRAQAAPTVAGVTRVSANSGTASASTTYSVAPGPAAGKMTVAASPSSFAAGGSSSLTASAVVDQYGNTVADGTTVNFQVADPIGNVTALAGTTAAGSSQVTLPGTVTHRAGTYAIHASSAAAAGDTSASVVPGPAAGAITFTANPSTVTAGQSSTLTGSAIADQYGNIVADGTTVTFTVTAPGGTVTSYTASAAGGAASVTLPGSATHLAGSASVSVSAGAASGSGSVTILPGAPFSLSLAAAPNPIVAGATAQLTASLIIDQYGNAVADGTSVTFSAKSPAGTVTSLSATSSSGSAAATLAGTASHQSGYYALTATAGSASAIASLTVQPGPGAGSILVTASPSMVATGYAETLSASAIADQYGNTVADGSSVTFTVTDPSSVVTSIATMSSGGGATVILAGSHTTLQGTYQVSASSGGAVGSTSFVASAGAAVGTFSVSASPSSLTTGNSTVLTASAMKDQTGNPAADGASVTFQVTDPGGVTTTLTSITSGGSASVTVSGDHTHRAGGDAVAVNSGSGSGSTTFQVQPGPASGTLQVSASPNPTTAGGAVSISVTGATDQYGNTVADGAAIAISVTDPANQVTHLSAATGNGSARATLPGSATHHAGSYPVSASSGGAAGAASFSVVGGPASGTFTVTVNPSSVTAGQATQITASGLVDQYGNPAADGTTVSFTVTDPGGTVTNLSASSSGGGTSPVTLPGTATHRAGRDGITGTAASATGTATLVVVGGPATGTMTVTAAPSTITAGYSSQLSAGGLIDQYGNAAGDGQAVTFTVTDPGGTTVAILQPTTSGGAASAALPGTATHRSGTYAIRAASGQATGGTSLTVNPSSAAGAITLVMAQSTITAGTGDQVSASGITDQYGNTVTDGTVVTFTAADPAGGVSGYQTATVSGSCSVTVAGTATHRAGAYGVNSAAGSAFGSTGFTADPGPPAGAIALSVSPSSVTAGQPSTLTASAVVDQYGNTVADGTSVTFASRDSAGSRFTLAAVTSAGAASVSLPGSDTQRAGSDSLSVSSGTAAGSATLTVVPGSAAGNISVTVNPSSITAGQTTQLLAAGIQDQFGNQVSDGTTVQFTATDVAGSAVQVNATTTGGSGAAALPNTATHRAGTDTVSASSGTASGGSSLTVSPGPGAGNIVLTAAPAKVTAGQPATLQAASITDQYGNPVMDGTAVNFTATAPGGTAYFLSATTTSASTTVSLPGSDTHLAGAYAIQAATGAASGSNSLIVAPGPAAGNYSVGANPASLTAGTATQLQASGIRDAYGNVIADGATVNFRVVDPAGLVTTLSGTSQSGAASAALAGTATQSAGTYSLGSSVANAAASNSFVVTGNPAGTGSITVSAADVAVGQPNQISASGIHDQYGNNVADGAGITFSISAPGCSGISCALVLRTSSAGGRGSVTLPGSADQVAGNYTVSVTSGAATGQGGFMARAGAAAGAFHVAVNPESILPNGSVTLFASQIVDKYGNAVESGTVDFSVTAPAGHVILVPGRVIVNGQAQSQFGNPDTVEGGLYGVTGRSSAATSDSTSFIVRGPFVVIAADIHAGEAEQITVPQILDAGGNIAQNGSANFTLTSPDASTFGTWTVPISAGAAVLNIPPGQMIRAGRYGVAVTTMGSRGSTSFLVKSAKLARIAISPAPTPLLPLTRENLTITGYDAYDNQTGYPGTLIVVVRNPDGSVDATLLANFNSGSAQVHVELLQTLQLGRYTVSAALGGVSDTGAFTVALTGSAGLPL